MSRNKYPITEISQVSRDRVSKEIEESQAIKEYRQLQSQNVKRHIEKPDP